jgi:hypothetical protein
VQPLAPNLCITKNARHCKIDIYPQPDCIIPVFAQTLHSGRARRKVMTGNQIIVLTME